MLTSEIERKYAGQIIADVGMCIAFYDFEELRPGFVFPADGAAQYEISFRMVVFRPFVGEILLGTIRSADETGLSVTMDFFDDIEIPAHFLQKPCEYKPRERLWVWQYGDDNGSEDGGDGGEGSGDENVFAFHVGEKIRFRVRSVNFTQVHETQLGRQATTTSSLKTEGDQVRKRSSSVDLTTVDQPPPMMQIIGLVNEDGLGLLSWGL